MCGSTAAQAMSWLARLEVLTAPRPRAARAPVLQRGHTPSPWLRTASLPVNALETPEAQCGRRTPRRVSRALACTACLFGPARLSAHAVTIQPTELVVLSPIAFERWTAVEPFRRLVFSVFAAWPT